MTGSEQLSARYGSEKMSSRCGSEFTTDNFVEGNWKGTDEFWEKD
jgi:hypothetical protein